MNIVNSPDIHNTRGRSLLPYLAGDKMNEIPALIESIPAITGQYTMNYVGIRTSEYKYFRDRNNATKNIHLYDLVKDHLEERNLVDELPDVVQKMENKLTEMQGQKFSDYEKSNELSDDEAQNIEKELRKLGYIN